jgi:tripartite-type tricarboxylate transporter receptor subunit TctC
MMKVIFMLHALARLGKPRQLQTLLVFLLALLITAPAHADSNWPDKPINLLVGFSPGGGADTLARLVARELQNELQQPVVVRNIAGGGGIVMATSLKFAPADGYTIGLAANSAFDGMPWLTELRYTPDDFSYLTTVSELQNALVTSGNAPFSTWDEMIAYGREHGLTYGSISPITRLFINMVAEKEGIRIRIIPMRGGLEAINNLIGGHIDIAWSAGVHQSFLGNGKIKVVASLNKSRLRTSPKQPSITELGYPVDYTSYFMLAAPKGIPPMILQRLSSALYKASKAENVAMLAEKRMGFPNIVLTAEELEDFIHSGSEAYRQAAEQLH